jgi:hypothetical protein
MTSDLLARLEAVCDEETLVAFVEALAADSQGCGWENASVESYLEAASAWAKDSHEGGQSYEKPGNPWKRCADILFMGRIYE